MKKNELYASPETEVMEVKLDSVIATSGLTAPGFEDGGDLDLLFG